MARRFVDIVVAILVLALLSPLFVLTSLVIVLTSPGNPFYGGWRIGKGGKRFRMWKFRTMVTGADRLGGALTTPGDSRVTKIGWFLRKTKLDELPQFFNLLLGDLTLIGPRPEDPRLAEQYTDEQKKIFEMKPGITGPVQLRYTALEATPLAGEINAEEFYLKRLVEGKVRLDLDYLNTRTFFSDCRILLQTILLMAQALTKTNDR
jgi:lipopolysaccharide/colanic/teichoic acid biosynthesis glycosyltransferase